MKRRNVYTVAFTEEAWSVHKEISVIAGSKAEAYDIAVYEEIPNVIGRLPYGAWVVSVTYQNGNQKFFNTCEGLAY